MRTPSAAFIAALATLSAAAGTPEWRVGTGEHTLTMRRGDQILWTARVDPAEAKPCFHPLATASGHLLTDFRPQDHPWHRGLWFSWKYINGVNYWEEDPESGLAAGRSRLVSADHESRPGQGVILRQALAYAPADETSPVLSEKRTIEISEPDAAGTYRIDWTAVFTAGAAEVVLDRTPLPGEPGGRNWGGYAGCSIRLARPATGTFLNSGGDQGEAAHRREARWVSYSLADQAAVLGMDHPDNPRHPAKWYVATTMPFFSPSPLHDAPLTLAPAATLTLRYRWIISDAPLPPEAAEAAWRDWTR